MPSAFLTALSGLRSHARAIEVISNNLANLNTFAFKGSRAEFRDLFYQQSGSADPAWPRRPASAWRRSPSLAVSSKEPCRTPAACSTPQFKARASASSRTMISSIQSCGTLPAQHRS